MTTSVYSRWIVVLAALTMVSAAQAGVIPIFNTGVNAIGVPLPDGTIGDPHFTLVTTPGGSTTDLRVRTTAGGFPIPPWVGDDAISAWIGPNNDAQVDGPIGVYDFRTTFSLAGLLPTTASLTGQWAVDNEGVSILINGVLTVNPPPPTNFTFGTFSVNGGFIAGVNTLDFLVNNDGGPIGLRVEVTGTADAAVGATPEPGSLVLFGAGFAVLYMFRRRLGLAAKLQ
jgi:hypothetical protein